MTRPAIFADIPAIEDILRDQHARSKYAGRVEISDKAMRDLLTNAVAGQKQNGPHASFLRIAEQGGKPVAFMLGVLNRVYQIGNKLVAQDVFLCALAGARSRHTLHLIDQYVAWACANPKVIEIVLSWNDALPGAQRIAPVYGRKGFVRTGELFEMRLDRAKERIAA